LILCASIKRGIQWVFHLLHHLDQIQIFERIHLKVVFVNHVVTMFCCQHLVVEAIEVGEQEEILDQNRAAMVN
jgi:hypothetical protein